MNEYDTELVRSILQAENFAFTHHRDQADVVLLNTCAIREHAHNKVYGHLGTIKASKGQRNLVVGPIGMYGPEPQKRTHRKGPID